MLKLTIKAEILKYDQELLTKMASIPDNDGKSISDYLVDLGVMLSDIQMLVSKENIHNLFAAKNFPMALGREIINGTIDVDRISYLRYDSLMTGVPYGNGIDMDGLLRNLVVRYEPPIAVGLAVNEEGVNAAEMILATVYWMYRNVYWHRTNRLTMAVLKHIFHNLMQKGALSFDQYIEETAFSGDRGALRLLESKYREVFGEEISNPLGSFLRGSRLKYHAVLEFGYRGSREGLWEKMVYNGTLENVKILTAAVADLLGHRQVEADPGILWDIPLKPRLPAALEEDVQAPWATRAEAGTGIRLWVKVRGASTYGMQWAHITEYSALAAAVTQEEDRQGRKIRLFVSDEVFERSVFKKKGGAVLEEAVLRKVNEISTSWPGRT